MATPASRTRRNTVLSTGVRFGRKLSASSSRMIVTTSTVNCVMARSGALKKTNPIDTIRPTIPIRISDNRRLRCIRTNPAVAATSISQPAMETGPAACIMRVGAPMVPVLHA